MVISRRGLVRTMIGAVVAGLGGAARPAAAQDAARRGPFWRAGKRCDSGQPCGELAPCFSLSGRCEPSQCLIDGVPRNVGYNPDNACDYCRPRLDDPNSWYAWNHIADGELCDVPGGVSGGVCDNAHNQCLGGVCVPNPLRDGFPCGEDGGECCAGECCHPGTICQDATCVPGCRIDDDHVPEGAINPGHDCEACAIDRSTTSWTLQDDDSACGPARDRVCCKGACCPPDQECGPAGLCEPRPPGCTVNGAWCGPNNNQGCCNGECCAYGQYCGHPDTCACCPTGEHCNGGVCEPW